MAILEGWENFYVILGSSAGALIGLQFVVMTLLAEWPASEKDALAGNAFGTPNVVHFGVVLLISAILVAPWRGLGAPAVLWGAVGSGGVVYALIVGRRMRLQKAYEPVFEDLLFHLFLPLLAYALMTVSACIAFGHAGVGLFVLGGAALSLLFIGIHNAWDTVMYHVFYRREKSKERQ